MNESRIVNLDDLANTVEIIVATKPFKISRITMEIRKVYGEYLILCGNYCEKVSKIQSLPDTLPIEELEKITQETQEMVTTFAIEKAAFIQKMLGLILKANGIEFDFAWWEASSDYQMMEQFIFQALSKDEKDTGSKKKATVN